MEWQGHLDHVASRVSAAFAAGALAGLTTAMYRGGLLGRTMVLTSLSCGMAATACFTAERLAAVIIGDRVEDAYRLAAPLEDGPPAWSSVLTHAIGGVVGGGVTGALYGKKPIQGALFLTPVMVAVGIWQELLDDARRERQLRLQTDGKQFAE